MGNMGILATMKAKQLHLRRQGMNFPLDVKSMDSLEGCGCVTWPFIASAKEVKRGNWIGIAHTSVKGIEKVYDGYIWWGIVDSSRTPV